MTISFQTGNSGWANYVINGTAQEPRDKSKIEIIDNDPFFVEQIASQNKFSGEYYKGVISVEKKITNQEMKEIWEEFKKELFVGYKKDEYIVSAVIHQDKDYTHIHFDVPKQNLLTGQHLQLYMHGVDTKRMDLIADDIAIRHNLKTKEEIKPTIKPTKEYSFEKQRAERNQEPFKFTLVSKKDKALAQQQVTELLKENIESINSLDEIKAFIHTNTDLKVIKTDFDRKKKFHYITIQDTNDKKTRVQGDLFSDDFFKQPKEQQMQQLQINHKTFSEVEKEAYAKQVRSNLKREREKRFKKVREQGRKLKLSIRQEQRNTNNTIRREDEKPRATIERSPSRSPSRGRERRKQQSNTITERAIQIKQERIRVTEATRQARERVLREFTTANNNIQERYRSNTSNIRNKYERKHRSVAERIVDVAKRTFKIIQSRVKNLFKKREESLEEDLKKFIKEKQAQQQQTQANTADTTQTTQTPDATQTEDAEAEQTQQRFDELMQELEKGTIEVEEKIDSIVEANKQLKAQTSTEDTEAEQKKSVELFEDVHGVEVENILEPVTVSSGTPLAWGKNKSDFEDMVKQAKAKIEREKQLKYDTKNATIDITQELEKLGEKKKNVVEEEYHGPSM